MWQAVVAFLVGVVLLAGIVSWAFQNRFVVLVNRCDESWSNVDTELRRRHELVPNLVRVVKGAAAHEKGLFTAVARARTGAVNATDTERSEAEERLVHHLDRLLAVAEDHPKLQASANFLELQKELAVTEDRIQAARRFYNANVRDLRDATRQFPGNLFALWFRPAPREFFDLTSSIHVKVVF